MENLFFQSQMDESKNPWRRSGPENIHLGTAIDQFKEVDPRNGTQLADKKCKEEEDLRRVSSIVGSILC